jgi:hypothetical protein
VSKTAVVEGELNGESHILWLIGSTTLAVKRFFD